MFLPINTAPNLATMTLLAAVTVIESAIPKSKEDAKRELDSLSKIISNLAKETLKTKVGKLISRISEFHKVSKIRWLPISA